MPRFDLARTVVERHVNVAHVLSEPVVLNDERFRRIAASYDSGVVAFRFLELLLIDCKRMLPELRPRLNISHAWNLAE